MIPLESLILGPKLETCQPGFRERIGKREKKKRYKTADGMRGQLTNTEFAEHDALPQSKRKAEATF